MPSKLGIHCIYPDITMPLVRAARERGAYWTLVKGVDTAGLAIDVKSVEPQTLTITRFVNPKWDSFQNGESWTADERAQVAFECIQMIFDRTNSDERKAADRFEIVNEADPPGVEGWRAYGHWLKVLIGEAEQRGLKLCLPAFNYGTPEWDEMVALVETGLFAAMKLGGHWLSLHEGVDPGSDDPYVFGPIPGAPLVPRAGPTTYRYRYLYHLLAQRNEIVPLVISEFYSGGGYNWDKRDLIIGRMVEYDREIRRDPYVLAVLPFTVDPTGDWQHQNYNPYYPAVLDYVVAEKDVLDVDTFIVGDISKHNSQYLGGDIWAPANFRVDIDFGAAISPGVIGFILRVGYGYFKDPCFDRYVETLDRLGIPWGIYHYFLPGLDAVRQADLARQWCPRLPVMGVYGDFEDDPAPYFGDALFSRTNNYLLRLDQNFGTIAGVYSRASYMDMLYDLEDQRNWRHRRGWWAAPGALKPNIGAGWMGLDPPYVLHQYTWAGTLPGFPRPLDLNRTAPGAPLSVLFDATFDPKENYMAYLSHRTKDDALLNKLDAIQIAIDIDLNNNVLGDYQPAGTVPPPPAPSGFPKTMRVRTTDNNGNPVVPQNLRDVQGNALLTNGVQATVPPGATVQVHMILDRIGPNKLGQSFDDRAVLLTDGRNIWSERLEDVP